jgi:hypothetical protein
VAVAGFLAMLELLVLVALVVAVLVLKMVELP